MMLPLWLLIGFAGATSCEFKDLDDTQAMASSLLQTDIRGMDEIHSSLARRSRREAADVQIVPDFPVVDSKLEYVAGLVWLAMLGSLPFTCAWIKGEQLTRSRKILGGCVTAWVAACVVIYTSLIRSASSNFPGARHLTLIETLYFLTEVLTTVGYGDIYPAFPSGQIVTAVVVLCAIFIVADAIGQLGGLIFSKLDAETQSDGGDPIKMQVKHMAVALTFHLVLAVALIAFDTLHLGWTLEDAIFSSISTATTVGFGVFTTGSKIGQLFLSFWMLIATASLANLVSAFGGLMSAIKDSEMSAMKDSGN